MGKRTSILLAVIVTGSLALAACSKGGATVPNPIGPINTGGKPDGDKTNAGAVGGGDPNLGGTPDVKNTNAGGAPDPNKSHGEIGNTGPTNSGGKPDVNKSVPKKK